MKKNPVPICGLGLLCSSFFVFVFTLPLATEYDVIETPSSPSVSTTPTPEGDDGSLGGPVYDENHQTKPTYVIKKYSGR